MQGGRWILSASWGLIIALVTACASLLAGPAGAAETDYLFASFRGNGEDGLHLAHSTDGLTWTALGGDKSFLKPAVGSEKLMRDPCILQGPDGVFHMVWTTGWKGRDIGYASSKDLVSWSTQKAIPVMAHEPDATNCWAPEVVYDRRNKHFMIFWATTIPGRFPQTQALGDGTYNHRMYRTTTKDFESFTPTQLFYDPGFNVIDATIVEHDDRYFMVIKDETREPAKKHLRVASAEAVEGPFMELSEPFTPDWVKGPSLLKIGEDWICSCSRGSIVPFRMASLNACSAASAASLP